MRSNIFSPPCKTYTPAFLSYFGSVGKVKNQEEKVNEKNGGCCRYQIQIRMNASHHTLLGQKKKIGNTS